jgi:ABC-type multidrug transport system fused ATPase/permease subunit
LLVLGGSNFLGGVIEAFFLIAVVRIGLVIADGGQHVGIGFGQDLSVGYALAGAAGLVVLRGVTAVATVWLSTRLREAVTLELRRRMADAYLRSSWAAKQEERTGRLQQLLNRYAYNSVGMVDAAIQLLAAGLTLLALMATAAVVDPVAWIVVFTGLGVLGLVVTPLGQRVRARSREAEQANMAFATSVSELADLGLEMQTLGVRDRFYERIDRLAVADGSAKRRTDLARGLVTPVYILLAYLALLGALAAVTVIGVADLASLGSVLLIMLRSLSYGQSVQGSLAALVASAPVLAVYYETAEHFEAERAPGGTERVRHVSELALRDVSFEYRPGVHALRKISMRIAKGEVVGIIGPSGAGKSTLVQLLLGLREPTEGTITADGRDLRTLSRDDWARAVAFVPQAPQLFDGTVAENIAFFRDELTDEQIEDAARRAHLHDEILAMPAGYASSVGPRGGRLSGGQQQRLCIARALAARPEVLILDEPTSSLDARSEALIRDTIAELRGRSTVIVIAHRLSTLAVADRVAVIQGGELVAFDTRAALQANDGFYRETLELSGIH